MQAPVKQVNALSTIKADSDEATIFDLVGPEDYLEEKMGASGCRFNEGFAPSDEEFRAEGNGDCMSSPLLAIENVDAFVCPVLTKTLFYTLC